jgi:pyruvate/2-oxoglutarate/acetoin dehydrogenase E1 component
MKYFDEVKKSMTWLGEQERSIFLGQAVKFPGTALTKTLTDVNKNKLIELPVFENMQMGMSTGLALNGFIPISIFPRFDFLVCAMDQLVNHLDKLPAISNGKVFPKMIIRTTVGSKIPLHPGHQHCNDYTEAFKLLLSTINVVKLEEPEQIFEEYKKAYNCNSSTLMIEMMDFYNLK